MPMKIQPLVYFSCICDSFNLSNHILTLSTFNFLKSSSIESVGTMGEIIHEIFFKGKQEKHNLASL